MAVILMAKLSLDADCTAELLGVGRATTFRDRRDIRTIKVILRKDRGVVVAALL